MRIRSITRRPCYTIFNETFVQSLGPRQHQDCAVGSEKFADLRAMLCGVARKRHYEISDHRAIAASTRNAQPNAPNTRLTTQNERFLVRAEIAAMAMAIWNMVTPRANTSCLKI